MNHETLLPLRLPQLSDAEAYRMLDALYDILLIIDNHYADQVQRHIQERNHRARPTVHNVLDTTNDPDIPF